MNVARELPGIVKLPSGDVLVAGGLTGAAAACEATPATPTAVTTNSSAEIFNPTIPSWTLTNGSSSTPGAAGGMTVKRIASGELFSSGTDSGLAIFAGGIDAETTDGTNPNFPTCEAVTNLHQNTQSATDLFDPTTTVFTATGSLHQSRGGYGFAILNAGSNSVTWWRSAANVRSRTLASAAIGSPESNRFAARLRRPTTTSSSIRRQEAGRWERGRPSTRLILQPRDCCHDAGTSKRAT